MHLSAQLHVLVAELLEVGIVVTDAPPLKDDDGHEGKHYHDDGDSQGNCNDK